MLQYLKQKHTVPPFLSLEIGSLGIVSSFVLRISDFQLLRSFHRPYTLALQNASFGISTISRPLRMQVSRRAMVSGSVVPTK